MVSTKGKLIGGQGAPGLGLSHNDAPTAAGDPAATLAQGRWPVRTGEVVLDERTADKAGYLIGEKVNIVSSGAQPRIEAKLVGIVTMAGGTAGASVSIFDTAEARTPVPSRGERRGSGAAKRALPQRVAKAPARAENARKAARVRAATRKGFWMVTLWLHCRG